MSSRIPIAVIKQGLQGRVEQLARELVPAGRRESSRWSAKNPTRADRHAGSFHIWLAGPAAGAWKDYATGDKGDAIDLVGYVLGLERAEAIRWAAQWLGLERADPAALARLREAAERQKAARDKLAAERDLWKRRRAFQMWLDAKPLAGTVAERYLGARGIALDAIPNPEAGELRFAPALEWWKGAEYAEPNGPSGKREKLRPGPAYPAIVAAIRDAAGAVVAVHCTFLRPDGADKAPVEKPKLMFGAVAGGVIRLTRGPSNLTPEEARDAGVSGLVAVGEGVEDGLTIGLACPEARVWAATSLGNLGNVPAEHPCVAAVVVAQDNDWGKPQAEAAFEAAIGRLAAAGKPVAAMRSHHGKDFNDLVRRGE